MSNCAQKKHHAHARPALTVLQGGERKISPEAVLAEARMELSVGHCVLDDHLAGRLESVARDTSLPMAYRAQALSLMCRFG
jgi:hypothetical protein